MELVAAYALFVLAGVVYFRGAFVLTTLLALGFWAAMARAMTLHASPGAAIAAIGLLIVLPAVFLVIHSYDAKRGVFLLPTIYAIPFAFLTGTLLLIFGTIAWAF